MPVVGLFVLTSRFILNGKLKTARACVLSEWLGKIMCFQDHRQWFVGFRFLASSAVSPRAVLFRRTPLAIHRYILASGDSDIG